MARAAYGVALRNFDWARHRRKAARAVLNALLCHRQADGATGSFTMVSQKS